MDGVLVLDKSTGISSHGAVQKLRRLTGINASATLARSIPWAPVSCR